MKTQEKIYKVLEILKEKSELSPKGAVIDYRAGEETSDLNADEEIMILNKLADEKVIEVVSNFAGDYI
ncbi:MAG: hypothetical protein COV01_02870 [Candidatus Taylorbacteria bacterium CG10_big_fil_rev_8_21_14_0_10_41_48]|uniref:Uncharacterized protein n=1 Tax=Candidatus Taylorbacteria bacterium CG10_big_fil_rev_8_21_14_0_10_41_48 TaxID=1975024 RepID=A0A2M8LBQ2_9BACT|nr:MAG: hypothetical protein COV01_02870 [Candidatus Taylorbacteria bacterium CG10_big_fil_rev_8_21_14_0_10_41_48]